MKLSQRTFENSLIFALVGACMFNPAAAAAGLLILLSSQVAERYFTRNISDADRDRIQILKAEVEKHAVIIQKDGLAKAFGGRQ